MSASNLAGHDSRSIPDVLLRPAGALNTTVVQYTSMMGMKDGAGAQYSLWIRSPEGKRKVLDLTSEFSELNSARRAVCLQKRRVLALTPRTTSGR